MSKRKQRMPCQRYLQVFNRVMVEGRAIDDVARELGLKVGSVTNIMHKVHKYMRQHGAKLYLPNPKLLRTINARELYLARLEHQYKELMQAWYRSQQPAETDKAGFVKKAGQDELSRGEKTRKTQSGNVDYLVQSRRILRDIRQVCMHRPYATKEENHVKLLTLKQREDALDRLLAEIGDRSPAAEDAGTDLERGGSARAA